MEILSAKEKLEVIRKPPLTLLQLKCFLSCKNWEKLKLILPFLVREKKGKREGLVVLQFFAPEKQELTFCAINLVNCQIDDRVLLVNSILGLHICVTVL